MRYLYIYTKGSDPSLEKYRDRIIWQFDEEKGQAEEMFVKDLVSWGYYSFSYPLMPTPVTRSGLTEPKGWTGSFEAAKEHWSRSMFHSCREISYGEAIAIIL